MNHSLPQEDVSERAAENGAALTSPALLELDGVRLGYWIDDRLHPAVGPASFSVAARQRVVLIGQSGCGKSTLLKAVAGLLSPYAGAIRIEGRPAKEPGPDRALVFQEFDQLFPWRTVLGNVAYPLRVNGTSRRTAEASARRFLELTSLSHAADRYPHQLSGGMKQRVAIARALALEPRLLLMDEPFGALDAITRQGLQVELNRIVRESQVTLLFVTHSIDEALTLGDRVVVLGGRPSKVVADVDVRDAGADREALRELLRELLGAEHESPAEDDGDRGR